MRHNWIVSMCQPSTRDARVRPFNPVELHVLTDCRGRQLHDRVDVGAAIAGPGRTCARTVTHRSNRVVVPTGEKVPPAARMSCACATVDGDFQHTAVPAGSSVVAVAEPQLRDAARQVDRRRDSAGSVAGGANSATNAWLGSVSLPEATVTQFWAGWTCWSNQPAEPGP